MSGGVERPVQRARGGRRPGHAYAERIAQQRADDEPLAVVVGVENGEVFLAIGDRAVDLPPAEAIAMAFSLLEAVDSVIR